MPGGRHRQRAFRDALADLLPPLHGFGPTIRIGHFEVERWAWLPHRGTVTSRGYNRRELRRLAVIVDERSEEFLERWHEFFG